MSIKTKTYEPVEQPLGNYNIYDVTHPVAVEVIGAAISEIDFGTVNVAAGDSTSAERCIILKGVDLIGNVHNLRTWAAKANMPGLSFYAEISDALAAPLAAAGAACGYVTKIAGSPDVADAMTFGLVPPPAGESQRLAMQIAVVKIDWGAYPLDPDKENNPFKSSVFMLWEDDSYIQRIDFKQGKVKCPAQLGTVNVAAIVNDYWMNLGFFEPTITESNTMTTITNKIGDPKTTVEEIITEVEHGFAGTLSLEDPALKAWIQNYDMAYDVATHMWKTQGDDSSSTLRSGKFLLWGFRANGQLWWVVVHNATIKITGDKSYHKTETRVPIALTPVVACGTSTNILDYFDGGNKSRLINIPVKFAVTV